MAPRWRGHSGGGRTARRVAVSRRDRLGDGNERRLAVGFAHAAGARQLHLLRAVLHRFRAYAPPVDFHRARRLPRIVPVLRRGEGVLPSPPEGEASRGVPAARARRSCAGAPGAKLPSLSPSHHSQRLPPPPAQRTPAPPTL